jgi:hypothetical protein
MSSRAQELSDWYKVRKMQRIAAWYERSGRVLEEGGRYWDMYQHGDTQYVAKLRAKTSESRVAIHAQCGRRVEEVEELLDLVYSSACGYLHNLDLALAYGLEQRDRDPSLGMSAFHKGMLGLFSALELTLVNLYGSARPILRQVFEWAVLAKYYLVFSDTEILKKWADREPVSLGRDVLSKLPFGTRSKLTGFWHDLCRHTHASTAAQQMFVEPVDGDQGPQLNLGWIRMMAECLYHLLNSWMIPRSHRDLVGRCLPEEELGSEKDRKFRTRQLLTETGKRLTPNARGIVYAYRRNWAKD